MQPLYQGSATFLGLRATFASQSEAAGRRPNFQRRPDRGRSADAPATAGTGGLQQGGW